LRPFYFLVLSLFLAFLAPSSAIAKQKVIYLSFEEVPERVFSGEYFSITLKTLSTISKHNQLKYTFKGARGAQLQNRVPQRQKKGSYVLDTFYFLATSQYITLPNITAHIANEQSTIIGEKIDGVALNPGRKYAHILADSFKITEMDAKKYDKKSNIITFEAKAEHCNISAFKLNNIEKQGFERKKSGIEHSSMTYYAVVDKKYEKLVFTYFNLQKKRYVKLSIPIVVEDDSVSTQTDLKPTESKHHLIKLAVAAAVTVILLILLLVYRKWWIALLIIFPVSFMALQAAPAQQICVNDQASLYLLPIENATVFEQLSGSGTFEVRHSVKGFKQIEHNQKIGWISEDDICSN